MCRLSVSGCPQVGVLRGMVPEVVVPGMPLVPRQRVVPEVVGVLDRRVAVRAVPAVVPEVVVAVPRVVGVLLRRRGAVPKVVDVLPHRRRAVPEVVGVLLRRCGAVPEVVDVLDRRVAVLEAVRTGMMPEVVVLRSRLVVVIVHVLPVPHRRVAVHRIVGILVQRVVGVFPAHGRRVRPWRHASRRTIATLDGLLLRRSHAMALRGGRHSQTAVEVVSLIPWAFP